MREDYYSNEYRFSREDYYPLGYRDDEEMCVYDQCCENCARQGCDCPFEDDDMAPRSKQEAIEEDAVMKDQELNWCIYWKQIKLHRF